MKLVVVESPYGSPYDEIVELNVKYARACVADCLMRGEAPIASHLLYTQPGVLNDRIVDERKRGIDAGLAWLRVAELSVVYVDLGVTPGMQSGIQVARVHGIEVDYRSLGRNWRQNIPEEVPT